jgi:iron complex outermembrane receptor protein
LDVGAYVYAQWKYKNLLLSGGVRGDIRSLHIDDFYIKNNPRTGFAQQVAPPDTTGASLQFPALEKRFTGASFSVGGTYPVTEQITLKANVARGYRSPSITEIGSNGLDPGAHIFYLGNRNFVPEFSFQQDLGVIGSFKNLSGTVSFFNNMLQHYIYLSQLVDALGKPVELSQGNKTYQYQQASARIYGMDAMLNLTPGQFKGLNLNFSFSTLFGNNTKNEFHNKGVNGQYLPFMPPTKFLSSIRQEIKIKSRIVSAIHFKTEVDFNASQNRYLALSHTETPTPGYTLINIGTGTTLIHTSKTSLEFMLNVNNLFNVAYQSNLSRLKYFEYYTQSPNGHLGIYNMGRNFSAKIIATF